jgi:hypothetical protein
VRFSIAKERKCVGFGVCDIGKLFLLYWLRLTGNLILLLIGIADLTIEEEQFLLEFLPLGDQDCKFPLIVLALITEEEVGLDEFVPFFFELLLAFDHLVLYLLFVGV